MHAKKERDWFGLTIIALLVVWVMCVVPMVLAAIHFIVKYW